jgi:hypothetical protein
MGTALTAHTTALFELTLKDAHNDAVVALREEVRRGSGVALARGRRSRRPSKAWRPSAASRSWP